VKESILGESLGAAASFLLRGRGFEQLRFKRRAARFFSADWCGIETPVTN